MLKADVAPHRIRLLNRHQDEPVADFDRHVDALKCPLGLAEGGDKCLDGLGHIWQEVEARRYQWPDPALTHEEVATAQHLLEDIYDSLVHQRQKFSAARKEILKRAPHGTPKEPLR